MDCSHQAPLSMKFSRQNYWDGLPFPAPGIFPTRGLTPPPTSPALAGRFFTIVPPGKPNIPNILDACSVTQSCPTLRPRELWPARLLCPRDSPGKNTQVGCFTLLRGIFLTQGPNPCLLCLLHWQVGSLRLAQPGKPPNILCMCKWYEQILLPACYFTKFSLNPYVGREGISYADTQHHQLLSREGFAGGKSQWGKGQGARTGVGRPWLTFAAPHIELQKRNFSCRLPSPGVAEITILSFMGLFRQARSERWWLSTSFPTWMIKPSLNIVGFKMNVHNIEKEHANSKNIDSLAVKVLSSRADTEAKQWFHPSCPSPLPSEPIFFQKEGHHMARDGARAVTRHSVKLSKNLW